MLPSDRALSTAEPGAVTALSAILFRMRFGLLTMSIPLCTDVFPFQYDYSFSLT